MTAPSPDVVRHMDDVVWWRRSAADGRATLDAHGARTAGLGFDLHPHTSVQRTSAGLAFLGVRVFADHLPLAAPARALSPHPGALGGGVWHVPKRPARATAGWGLSSGPRQRAAMAPHGARAPARGPGALACSATMPRMLSLTPRRPAAASLAASAAQCSARAGRVRARGRELSRRGKQAVDGATWARPGCSGAALGTTTRGMCALPSATRTSPTTATRTSASGSPERRRAAEAPRLIRPPSCPGLLPGEHVPCPGRVSSARERSPGAVLRDAAEAPSD